MCVCEGICIFFAYKKEKASKLTIRTKEKKTTYLSIRKEAEKQETVMFLDRKRQMIGVGSAIWHI